MIRSLLFAVFVFSALQLISQEPHYIVEKGRYQLTTVGASHLAQLPLKCIEQQFPYKTGVVYSDSTAVVSPKNYHPIFYGCFDWHSSAHGHWMLVRLLRLFPSMNEAGMIHQVLRRQLTAQNVAGELRLFNDKNNRSFERTYGWAWILQLQKELIEWNDDIAKELAGNLQPLADSFSVMYRRYLSKLVYPVRGGEHANLAFGLRLAWDYAEARKDDSLKASIRSAALRFYHSDATCPISWEPGGSDFLSPCLEEADLMWRILPRKDYEAWVKKFLPQMLSADFTLPVGEVKDRSDGKLVHLDGLNFSRAWCLHGIAAHTGANSAVLNQLAQNHLEAALPHVASGEYMGEHWLASFAVYALTHNLTTP